MRETQLADTENTNHRRLPFLQRPTEREWKAEKNVTPEDPDLLYRVWADTETEEDARSTNLINILLHLFQKFFGLIMHKMDPEKTGMVINTTDKWSLIRKQISEWQKHPETDFEKNIFNDGIYVFNLNDEVPRPDDRQNLEVWLNEPDFSDQADLALAEITSSNHHELAWKNAFSGLIPKNWQDWFGAYETFRDAGAQNVQLSPLLINAGISHFNSQVVIMAGSTQKLTPDQLGLIIGNGEFLKGGLNRVISAQKRKGMSDSDLQTAEVYGERVKLLKEATKPIPNP